jgi:glutathione S-transferase
MVIIGNFLSPFTRKVLAVMRLKGLSYELDPVVPFFTGEAFTAISPLRRIPVLVDGGLILYDSTVILEYLEDKYPTAVTCFPSTPEKRAINRQIEEFCDTALGDVALRGIYATKIAMPKLRGGAVDEEQLAASIAQMPVHLDEVERWFKNIAPGCVSVTGESYMCSADLALAVQLQNAAVAGYVVDASKWPRTASHFEQLMKDGGPLKWTTTYVDLLLPTPPTEFRKILEGKGLALSNPNNTYATSTPTFN